MISHSVIYVTYLHWLDEPLRKSQAEALKAERPENPYRMIYRDTSGYVIELIL
jgi:hypothetical protein